MKQTLLAIALTAATLPFTFAGQAPTTQPGSNPPAQNQTQTPKVKKAKKRHHKRTHTNKTAKNTTPAPAAQSK